MSRRGHIAIGLAPLALCGGCLSIFVDDQVVEVRTSGTDGAYCEVVDSTGRRKEVAYTPGFVRLSRGDGPINLRCEKDGFVGPDQRVDERFNNWTLLTGLLFWPGFVYDAISGAYQRYPDRVEIPMKAATGPAPPQTRRSDGTIRRSAGAAALGPNDMTGAVAALDVPAEAPMAATRPSGQVAPTLPVTDVARQRRPSGVPPNPLPNPLPNPPAAGASPQTSPPGPAALAPAPAAGGAADPYADLHFGVAGFGDPLTATPPLAPAPGAAPTVGGSDPAGPSRTVTAAAAPPFARATAGSGSVIASSRAARPSPVDPRQAMVLVPPPTTGFGVQVGVYGVRENADIEIAYLNSLGLAAYTRRSSDGRLTMVRFGPFANRPDARAAAQRYLHAGGGEAMVIRN